MITPGSEIPGVQLGALRGDQIVRIDLRHRLLGCNALLIGLPGAFTPVCTREHIPDMKRSAARLRRAGYSRLICISSNDPYVLDLWRAQVDPEGDIEFLSDGNLDFGRATGLISEEPTHFLGRRVSRFLMTVVNGAVSRLVVEPDPLCLTVTRPSAALAA
jgi:peroxiredoxin